MKEVKFVWTGVLLSLLMAFTATADTQSDMERLFGKKIADQTAKPKAWATKKPAPVTSSDTPEKSSNTAKQSNFDVRSFDVMGVTVGVKLDSTVDRFSKEFPPESELTRQFPDSKFVNYTPYNCEDLGRKHGCDGALTEYTLESQMVRSEKLSFTFTKNKNLYRVFHKYISRVADNYSQCKIKLDDYKNQLLSKYGQPTYTQDRGHVRVGSYTDNYGFNATWNDAKTPTDSARISIGCTTDGKFIKQLSIQAESINDAEKKKTTTAGIR